MPLKMLLRSHPDPLAGLVSASSRHCECGSLLPLVQRISLGQ